MANAMKMTVATLVALMAAFFVIGCKKDGGANTAVSNHAKEDELAPASADDVTMAALARITSATVSLTNCLFRDPGKAMTPYRQIFDEIDSLPSVAKARCVKDLARSILAVPYEQLGQYERAISLRAMWDMMGDVGWPGIGEVDVWEMRMLRLYRMRASAEFAQSETNNWTTRSFIAVTTGFLESDSEYLEQILAEWISSPYPPKGRAGLGRGGEMTEEDYKIVKEKLERFLGRPIRTREEISRAQIERSRQLRSEMEQREAERQQRAAQILEDKRSGKKASWYTGFTTNQQESTINPSTRK